MVVKPHNNPQGLEPTPIINKVPKAMWLPERTPLTKPSSDVTRCNQNGQGRTMRSRVKANGGAMDKRTPPGTISKISRAGR